MCRYIFSEYRSGFHLKVIGSRSRSREQKKPEMASHYLFCSRHGAVAVVSLQLQWRQVHFSDSWYDATWLRQLQGMSPRAGAMCRLQLDGMAHLVAQKLSCSRVICVWLIRLNGRLVLSLFFINHSLIQTLSELFILHSVGFFFISGITPDVEPAQRHGTISLLNYAPSLTQAFLRTS